MTLTAIKALAKEQRRCSMKLHDLAIDDLFQAGLAEFDDNVSAEERLNAAYVEARLRILAELEILRAERAAEI